MRYVRRILVHASEPNIQVQELAFTVRGFGVAVRGLLPLHKLQRSVPFWTLEFNFLTM